ncbi:MAG: hypothetical protein K6A40_04310 [Solobacterium sp.]|nr:hypothetical protein [Solobacterium sp.]
MKYAVIILVFAAAVLTYFQFRQRQAVKALSDRLSRLLMEGRYDEFEVLVNDRETQVNLSNYNLQHLAFTEAVLRSRKKEADLVFDAMPGVRMNNIQKASFYSHAMPFYAEKKDEKRTDICYEQILLLKRFRDLKKSTAEMYGLLKGTNKK